MISTALWETLPDEEKKYWHSHKYEVWHSTALFRDFSHPDLHCTYANQAVAQLSTCNVT